MPKVSPKRTVNLNLLKPQSNPERFPVKLLHWLLSSGRYIFVFVEALVLIAFIARFKLDADIASMKEAIEEQIPYIESLKTAELLIRQTQLKIFTITTAKTGSVDWPGILKKIADQTPAGVKIVGINLEKNLDKTAIHITADAKTNSDLNGFLTSLKEDPTFYDTDLTSIGLDQNNLRFSLDTFTKSGSPEGENL